MQPPPPAESSSRDSSAAPKVWRAGTLTYTSGGLAVLFGWLLWGDFAWMLKERSAFPVVQIMLRKFEASDWLTGFFLLSLPAAIGLILVPVVSYRSDRHRGRWGRRIPYLIVTTPMAAIALAGIAFCPLLAEWLHTAMGWPADKFNITVITLMGLSWTVFEFGTVIANAIFLSLLNDVVPREWLGRFFGMFRAVSLLTGMVFNYYLIGHVREHHVPILAGIAAIYGIGFMMMCLKVKEGEYPPPETMNPDQPRGFVSAVRTYGRECFTQPYYILIFAALALAPLSFTPVNLYSIYAADHFGLSMETYGKFIVGTYACSLLLAYPLGWMADRVHALRMAIGSLAIYVLVMIAGWFWVGGPQSFGIVLLVHGVISGCYFTGAAALGQMLFPKLKFAQFASAGAMLLSVCNIAFGPAMGRVLDWLDHDYRYTFGAGALIALAALAVTLAVYRRFLALGGTKNYVAP